MRQIFDKQSLTIVLIVSDSAGAVIDLATMASLTITFQRPAGSSFSKTATLTTNGSDGKMEYTTTVDDLDAIGTWLIQGVVIDGAGDDNPTDVVKLEVLKRLPKPVL